ncbi:MarR family winged helix-turn-helix transcriptional regulator [Paenibacillus camelliae]|uniref:MarR family winged helix-turn-helix transcriptional regulator n=1 Tax=Paenibacillus camelliae TaxID=512410 RepID=UPI00203ABBCC|nr:MarR family transcriptional regulator [Paenibacillus camelliae]MCM3634062.1 MarR family transcriptional regulator [Paenibacillus camelliae]
MTTNLESGETMSDGQLLMSTGFLLGVTHRRVVALLQHRLKEYDITPEQWSVLFHIVSEEGMIQKHIAEQTFKDKPTVTRILHQLEGKEFIVREADPSDRRSYRIFSTEHGRKIIAETHSIEQSIDEEMKRCLGEEGHDQLNYILIKVNDHFRAKRSDD